MGVIGYLMILALLLVCGAAAIRGGWPERTVAGALLVQFAIGFLGTILLHVWEGGGAEGYKPLPAGTILAVDIVTLAVLWGVAVRARPPWTLFAAAFQLLATLTSVVNSMSGGLNYVAYATAQNMLWWMMLGALAYGAWRSWGTGRASTAPAT